GRQRRLLVREELLVLRDALRLKRLHDFGDESRQLALGLYGVLSPDNVVADESEVIADEYPRAERDADREGLVVRIAQADKVTVVAVGTPERHHAEVARAVFGDGVVLFGNLMAVEAQGVAHQLHDFVMRHWDVGVRSCGSLKRPQVVVAYRLRA